MLRLVFHLLRSTAFAFAFIAATTAAHAQSVRWEPGAGTLARDQVSRLSLVFQDTEPKSAINLPAVDGLEFIGQPARNEQNTFNLTLGSRAVNQSTVTYVYSVRPTRPNGEVRIPAFTVETTKGALTVPAAGYKLDAATVGQSGLALDQIATASFIPPAAPIWAGEVFRLSFLLDVDRRYVTNEIVRAPMDWKSAPLIAESWSQLAGNETQVNGQRRFHITSFTRAIAPATTATLLPIPPASQVVYLPTGQASPFALFGQTTFQPFTLTTAPTRLAINPLPSPAPADFIGAVGQFTLSAKVVPETATVGEPITWTITLEGTGNWPAIDRLRPRSLSRDFRVIAPRAQKTTKTDSLFDGSLTEDLVLIPQKAGRTTLPAYSLSIFNPTTGAYETLRSTPVELDIAPAAAPAPTVATTDPSAPSATIVPQSGAPILPATPPAALPSDPLPTGDLSAAPLAPWPGTLTWATFALVLPATLWLALAARHARLHDPLLPRRHAHDQLRQILTRLETGQDNASQSSAADLLAWQHHTATLFGLQSATPAATELSDPLWARLWIESERALYRAGTSLSREWFAQAWQAHAAAAPKPPSPLAALRLSHLFPSVLVLGLAFIFTPRVEAAPSPESPYTKGAFAEAEKADRAALEKTPLSFGLHHNLALALGQQGKWDEAHAHAYVAALQSGAKGPAADATARLLTVTTPRASYRTTLPPAYARAFTLRQWQHLAFAAAVFLLVAVPSAYLVARYQPAFRLLRLRPLVIGHWSLVISSAALLAALVAIHSHGAAIHPAAVIAWRSASLRAVPTDVGDQKILAELPAGSLARIDKSFLGWRRLVLPDGNTGWVRVESLVGLWQSP